MKWSWWTKYVLNIDTMAAIAVLLVVLYFIFTSKRRKYKFDIPDGSGHSPSRSSKRKDKGRTRRRRKLNKSEEECRKIFQREFKSRFKSVRPKWLKNPVTGRNLELDGYNPKIVTPIGTGLAFEYDGQQHSKYVPHFHPGGPDEFEYQVTKDSWKDKTCKKRGVMLIRIPHFVAFPDLTRYIKAELKRRGVDTHQHRSRSHAPQDVYRNFSSGAGLYG
jgi:hypothetical protein